MSRLYPSLEDMKVDQAIAAQNQVADQVNALNQQGPTPIQYPGPTSSLYPSLDDYMGMDLAVLRQNPQNQQVAIPQNNAGDVMVAPISGNDVGIRRAAIHHGLREVICCKDGDGKIGLRVRHVNKGIFVAMVVNGSPAALAGLRFGDQILQIDGQTVAGWDTDKTMKVLRNANPQKITFVVRDRPFERTITMQKDSTGHIGFIFKDGKITQLVKDSSACRNGVLIDHQLIEVNGQNVVGLKDKDALQIFSESPQTVTITIMPLVLYEHIVKCMGNSLVKKLMDHSIPDL